MCYIKPIVLNMYIHYQFTPRSGGRMTRVCYVSQTRVMLRAIALVIFPSFQSGLHPDDGHALQSSLDLRPQEEGPTLTTLVVAAVVFLRTYPPCSSTAKLRSGVLKLALFIAKDSTTARWSSYRSTLFRKPTRGARAAGSLSEH